MFDALSIAIKNLFRHKLRTLMTLLGATIGISAFVSLTSFSNGFRTQLEDMVKSYSIDITVMSKGAATPTGSMISVSDYKELSRMKHVRGASSLVVGPVTSPWNPYFLVFGLSSMESFLNKLGIVEGRVIVPGRKEVLMGERAAQRFKIKVNDKIFLAQQELFTVVGISSSGSRIIDGGAVLDIKDAQQLLRRYDTCNMAFLQVDIGSDAGQVAAEVNRRFQNLTAVKSGEFIAQYRVIKTVGVFAWVVSIIAFITCCIIVMNTFLMVVSERTKEIGILMAIGWSRAMMMKVFILESMVICFLGGIFGNVTAVGALWFFHAMNPEGLGWLVPTSVSAGVMLESIGLSLVLGIAGSLYPAFRASSLVPSEALRYE